MELHTVLTALMEHDDYQTVHEYASEYGEPGYSTRGGPVLLGDYWCRRQDCGYPERYDDNGGAFSGKVKLHSLDYHYPRVFAFLEREGCELEWHDEWTVVDDKAYRTQADSYSWQPTAVWNDEICDYMVNGEDIDLWLEWATNNPRRCLMRASFTDDQLREHGFVERECDYESGWYGREDNPQSIFNAITEREPNTDVLFKLANVEQFRVTFCVFVRERGTEETPDTLNARMEIDHVIRVLEDGTVLDVPDVWAPCLYDGELEGSQWSLLDGWSGQDRYSGPIMHASEYIGGGMARWILENPGTYVAVVDQPTDNTEPEGWAVARLDD
jgi:hypothetical protein